jgi:hypothetical protein
MRKIRGILLSAGTIAGLCLSGNRVAAQVYSGNIVGYINLPIYAGNNLVANQLDNGTNTLSSLFAFNVPEGATFTMWDASQHSYLPLSTYDVNSGWSINYLLTFGEGGLLDSPTTFTNTYVGSVWSGFTAPGPFTPPLISQNELLLLSCYVPLDPTDFYDVVGRDPQNGDYVEILDALTQTETVTTYRDGFWDNGVPTLTPGESAFYGLGGASPELAPVPEPPAGILAGMGLFALAIFRRFRRSA